jgi:integration host factor subunit alpha
VTLTKKHLVHSITNRLGFSEIESFYMLEFILEAIKTALSYGEDVLISGFGRFLVKEKASRKGRNPQTGEDLPLDARAVVRFHCSEILKRKINGRG